MRLCCVILLVYHILKGAAAPPAAGPFNSTLHTGDPISGLNVVLLYYITYALPWWHMISSCVSCKSIPNSTSIVLGLLSGKFFAAHLRAWFDFFSC